MKLADQIHAIMEENDNLTDEQLGQAVDSFLQIHTEEIQEDGLDTYHCHRYEPTPYRVLEVLFDAFPLTKEDVLLDWSRPSGIFLGSPFRMSVYRRRNGRKMVHDR